MMRFLIIILLITVSIDLDNIFAQSDVSSGESKWKTEVSNVWEDIMKARLKKSDEKELNEKLEKLIEEGKTKKYKISLSEKVPVEINLPGVPEGEQVIGGVNKKEQETKPENKVDNDKTKGGLFRGAVFFKVSPSYPIEAKNMDVDPTVIVFIIVSKEGKVIDAKCKSGDKVFHKSALSAASRWRFYPSTIDGNSVYVAGALTFNFQK